MNSQNVGAMHDAWLLSQADEYMESFCEGEPKVINTEEEFEGYDEDGRVITSTNYIYSCEECEEKECEHWKDFHKKEYEEYLKESGEEDE